MQLTWLGHSAFHLHSGGTVLMTDPFPSSLGLRVPDALSNPNVVTISNAHPNHSATKGLGQHVTVLTEAGDYEVANLQIRGLRTPLSPSGSVQAVREWNTIFVIRIEGMTVCHLGDLAAMLTSRQIEEVSSPDVLLLPVGGHCTIAPAIAAELANAIAPRIVVPMHYAHPAIDVDLDPLSPFLREMGLRETEAQPRLELTKSSLPGESQLVGLQPAATSAG